MKKTLLIILVSLFCENSFSKTLRSKEKYIVQGPFEMAISLEKYLSVYKSYKNVVIDVSTISYPSHPCPICPPKVMCKPCYTTFIILKGAKEKILINYPSAVKLPRNIFDKSTKHILSIRFLGINGSGAANSLGFFELVRLRLQ